jgi:replicative DNA helicase
MGSSRWINKDNLDDDGKLEIVQEFTNDLFKNDTGAKVNFVPLAEYAGEAEEIVKNWGKKQGYLTRISAIDDLTYGMCKGELVIVAGTPGVGKSALIANVAINLAKQGTLIGILNLEIKNGQLAGRVAKAYPDWMELPIAVSKVAEGEVITAKDVTPAVKELAQGGAEVLIVDYLQMLALASKEEYQEVSNVVRALKSLAVTHNILVLAISSLNRGRDEGELGMKALHGSGKIEFFADIILFLQRDQDNDELFVKIVKNRSRKYDYKDNKRVIEFDGSVMKSPEPVVPIDVFN